MHASLKCGNSFYGQRLGDCQREAGSPMGPDVLADRKAMRASRPVRAWRPFQAGFLPKGQTPSVDREPSVSRR
jgi:hypothetical protein